MLTDIEISNNNKLKPINKVAKRLGIKKSELEFYGDFIAKIKSNKKNSKQGKLILVTSINPTKSGEGKSTISIGLADALSKIGKKTCLALREPSLGPVFGIKGGACGGGYCQVVPMENINLHFTGDMHSITSANNLLSAIIDNHIHQGNELKIKKVFFERCIDINDRALKNIQLASGRQDKFTITSASEVMAILTLSRDLKDLKRRLSNIIVGENESGELIYARDLHAEDAMAILLKDAIKPNLVQTLEHTPAIVHCGPFANIAHGCNSTTATLLALNHADYVVTEAGFGADLGAEKFLDLKCQTNGIAPNCVCLVVTVKALKLHGGENFENLKNENLNALRKGCSNLQRHIENLTNVYKLPVVVAINKFYTDSEEELQLIKTFATRLGVDCEVVTSFEHGSKGAINLAKKVITHCNNNYVEFAYDLNDDIKTKIEKVATKIYRAKSVKYTTDAEKMLEIIDKNKFNKLPIVIAKTQYSFSDNKDLLNAPDNFDITITDIKIRSGAEFIVAISGNMLLMPGLAKHSAYEKMTIDENGKIDGLF